MDGWMMTCLCFTLSISDPKSSVRPLLQSVVYAIWHASEGRDDMDKCVCVFVCEEAKHAFH